MEEYTCIENHKINGKKGWNWLAGSYGPLC